MSSVDLNAAIRELASGLDELDVDPTPDDLREAINELRALEFEFDTVLASVKFAHASRSVAPAIEMKFAADAEGSFSGYASKYGEVDDQGDAVLPGAFSNSLSKDGYKRPLLWAHDQSRPIGVVNLVDLTDGLFATGQLVLESAKAREAQALTKAGATTGLSIGYRTVKSTGRSPRQLQEVDLLEVSIVAIPALRSARISSMKSTADHETRLIVADLRGALAKWKLPA